MSSRPQNEPDADERYEFRCWPLAACNIHRMLREHCDHDGVDERVDVYFIQDGEDVLTKLRGVNRFEIKKRLSSHDDAELWKRTFSEPLPLCARSVQYVNEELATAFNEGAFRMPAAVVEAFDPYADPFPVKKMRRRYTFGDCLVDATRVTISTEALETIGLECTALPELRAAVRFLGLDRFENTHYGRKIRALSREGERQ